MRLFLIAIAALGFAAPAIAQSGESDFPGTFAAQAPSPSDLGRAQEALQQGQFRRAAWLLAPLADGGFNPQVHLLAGFANLGAGDTAKAERYFQRSLRFDSRSVMARQGLGLVALARGNRAAAQAELGWIERAGASCAGKCDQARQIDSAAASLRRAIG